MPLRMLLRMPLRMPCACPYACDCMPSVCVCVCVCCWLGLRVTGKTDSNRQRFLAFVRPGCGGAARVISGGRGV
jgi:hypothetical protein